MRRVRLPLRDGFSSMARCISLSLVARVRSALDHELAGHLASGEAEAGRGHPLPGHGAGHLTRSQLRPEGRLGCSMVDQDGVRLRGHHGPDRGPIGLDVGCRGVDTGEHGGQLSSTDQSVDRTRQVRVIPAGDDAMAPQDVLELEVMGSHTHRAPKPGPMLTAADDPAPDRPHARRPDSLGRDVGDLEQEGQRLAFARWPPPRGRSCWRCIPTGSCSTSCRRCSPATGSNRRGRSGSAPCWSAASTPSTSSSGGAARSQRQPSCGDDVRRTRPSSATFCDPARPGGSGRSGSSADPPPGWSWALRGRSRTATPLASPAGRRPPGSSSSAAG